MTISPSDIQEVKNLLSASKPQCFRSLLCTVKQARSIGIKILGLKDFDVVKINSDGTIECITDPESKIEIEL